MKYRILLLCTLVVLSACSSTTITYTGTATGYNKEVILPIDTVTQKTPSPTIIIAHPSDGLTGYGYTRYVLFWGSLISSWGYNAVVPDSFHGRGYRNKEVMYQSMLVNYDERSEDMIKVAEWIKQQSWHKGKIGIIGFSHGGGTVIRTANTTDAISAGVAYYPGCFDDDKNTSPLFSVEIHIGNADDWTTAHRCISMAKKSNMYRLYVYQDATHGFDIPVATRKIMNYTLAYEHEAAIFAQERTRIFFDKHLRYN